MAASRRLGKELQELKENGIKSFRNIVVDEQNILNWQGLIVPENPPYNKGAFKIEINFPGTKQRHELIYLHKLWNYEILDLMTQFISILIIGLTFTIPMNQLLSTGIIKVSS